MHDFIRTIIDFSMAIAQEAGFSPNVRQLASHIIATVAAENGGIYYLSSLSHNRLLP